MEGPNDMRKGNGMKKWVTVALGRKLHDRVKQAASVERLTLHDFCLRAIDRTANHNISIGEPRQDSDEADRLSEGAELAPDQPWFADSPSEKPLSDYAKDARTLTIVGTTLRSITDPAMSADFIAQKAADEQVSLTLALLGEEVLRQPVLLEEIQKRRARRPTSDIAEEVRRSLDFLRDLKKTARAEIKVFGLKVVPTIGLTILDPETPQARMRVSFYLYKHPSICDPVVHISKRDPEGARAYELFLGHYRRLVEDIPSLSLDDRSPK